MKFRICNNKDCNNIIDESKNNNTIYCSDECYYQNKLYVTNLKNIEVRRNNNIVRNDDILKFLYSKFGSMNYVDAILLEELEFDWSLVTETIIINSLKAILLKNYAYTLFKNEKIIIWKI